MKSLIALCLSVSTCLSIVGCTTPVSNGPDGGRADGGLAVFGGAIYSGFDATNTYKIPVVATGATGTVTWSASDATAVEIHPETDTTMVTFITRKAGDFTINAKDSAGTASIPLHVYSYTAAQYTAGSARYHNTEQGDPACLTCHNPPTGIDHTPTQTSLDTDAVLTTEFTKGLDAEGKPINSGNHSWHVTAVETTGILAYLRSLTPSGYPDTTGK